MRIADMRTYLGWTQEEMGDYLGVNYHTVGNWETGKQVPSPLAVKRMFQLQQEIMDETVTPKTHQTAQDRPRRLLGIKADKLYRWLPFLRPGGK